MTLTVGLRPEAEQDLSDAALWYEKQRLGLGNQFLDEILTTIDSIVDTPSIYPIVIRNTRRAVVHRFPFNIFYQIADTEIVIIAVMHGSRHPRRWIKRL